MSEITTWEELKAHQARMEQALVENQALLDTALSEVENLDRVVRENRRRVAHLKKAIANKATPQEAWDYFVENRGNQ